MGLAISKTLVQNLVEARTDKMRCARLWVEVSVKSKMSNVNLTYHNAFLVNVLPAKY